MAIRLAVLGSGSAGNATCIEGGGARILLDAGFSCRQLAARLGFLGVEPHRLDAIVLTHEHADHVGGAALFSRTYNIPIYATAGTLRAASLDDGGVPSTYAVEAGTPFALGGLTLTPFAVPHDAVETVGFSLEAGETRVGYATDLGHGVDTVRRGLAQCDMLVLEANHDAGMLKSGPYPEVVKQRVLGRHGHLDNESAADLLGEITSDRTRRVILAHLSRTNNRPELAIGAARRRFEEAGRKAPALHPADQAAPSPWFEV